MALSWTTLRTIPSLHTYEAAAAHEANVKPIRGDKYNTKPLGRRDMKFNYIRRLECGDIVVGRGWPGEESEGASHIVRYHVDGTITLYANRWRQKATRNDIIGALLPGYCKTYGGKAWYVTHGTNTPLKTYERGGTRFKHDERGALRPVDSNVGEVITHVLNRKAIKEGLAPYQQFLGFAVGMLRVRGCEPPSHSELVDVVGKEEAQRLDPEHWSTRREGKQAEAAAGLLALMRSEEPEDNYKAYVVMARNIPFHGPYLSRPGSGYSRALDDRDETWRNKMVSYLCWSDLEKYLVRKVHTDGKLHKDRYAQYAR